MRVEVTVLPEEVERFTGNLVFAQKRALLPGYPDVGCDEVVVDHLALEILLETGDAGVRILGRCWQFCRRFPEQQDEQEERHFSPAD